MNRKLRKSVRGESASIEMIVLGLLAALIVVLCVPLLTSIGQDTQKALSIANSNLNAAVNPSPAG